MAGGGKASKASGGGDGKSAGPARKDGDVGKVLRSVYDHAVNEEIPAEMLALLGKLD